MNILEKVASSFFIIINGPQSDRRGSFSAIDLKPSYPPLYTKSFFDGSCEPLLGT